MTGFGSVGADEADAGVGVQDGAFLTVSLDGAVEEDNGGAGGDHVDDQQVVAVGNGGLDLLVLGGLVVVTVEVVVGNAQAVQLCVQSGADAGNVGVGEGVVEHADLQLGSFDLSLGLVPCGSGGGSGVSAGGGGLGAAGGHGDYHDKREQQCKCLFHCFFPP